MRLLQIALLCFVWMLASAPKSEAATLSAVFRGTVGSGTDWTGVFGTPGSDLTGEEFVLQFIYDPATPGAELITDLDGAGGADSELLAGSVLEGWTSPVQSAVLIIKGVSRALQTLSGSTIIAVNSFSPNPVESSVSFTTWEFAENGSPCCDTYKQNIFNIHASTPTLDIPANLSTPFALTGLTGESGSFSILECNVDRDSGRCGDTRYQIARGTLYAESVVVTQIPLPAALPLLVSGLGLLSYVSWRRKKSQH